MYYPVEWESKALEVVERAGAAQWRVRARAMAAERAQLARRRRRAGAFLFLDYDMWLGRRGVRPVEPPPGPPLDLELPQMVRVADVRIMRAVAPKLLKLYNNFEPTFGNLREVLEIEAMQADPNIEEAACEWAMKNPATFEYWFKMALDTKYQEYEVIIFLCADDPDQMEYRRAADVIKEVVHGTLNVPYKIRFLYDWSVDCEDEYAVMRKLVEQSRSAQWARLAGALAPGAGGATGAGGAGGAAAAALGAALLPYAPAPRLARALRRLAGAAGWARLALLAARGPRAARLARRLRDLGLLVKQVPVEPVRSALDAVQQSGGRIIFIDSGDAAARSVLCAADELGMSADAGYVWILREWHAAELACGNRSVPGERLAPLTVSPWWRGRGGGAAWGGGAAARALRRLWPRRAWPQYAAPFADALALLLHSFNRFFHDHPQLQDDLHGGIATRFVP